MIITEKIEIKVHHLSLENYKKYGYNVSNGDIITVPTNHLPENSHEVIEIMCDGCNSIKNIEYRTYLKITKKNNDNKYYCNKCNNILREKTNIEKYGVTNVFKNENIKNKWKNTVIEKYGTTHPSKTEEIKTKIFNTNLKKYGVKYLMQNEEIKNKSIETCKEKYNGNSSSCCHLVREKQTITMQTKYGYKYTYENKDVVNNMIISKNDKTIKKYKNIISIDNTTNNYKIKCELEEHIYEININLFHERLKRNIMLCTTCNPVNNGSSKEIELKNFIKNNYSGEIIENSKNIIKPYEIDIYLPELNIGFEFNGLYWHSDKYKHNDYHQLKQKQSNEKNIKLYNIYEDEWIYKRHIVESNILKLLNISNIITNVVIKNGSFTDVVDIFINENTLLIDYDKNSNYLYVYDNINNLIGLVSFIENNDIIEIIGLYEKINIKIDFIKLLSNYFINKTVFIIINRDWDNLNLINKVTEIQPIMYYIINDKKAIIESNHKYKIYDSGKIIYKL